MAFKAGAAAPPWARPGGGGAPPKAPPNGLPPKAGSPSRTSPPPGQAADRPVSKAAPSHLPMTDEPPSKAQALSSDSRVATTGDLSMTLLSEEEVTANGGTKPPVLEVASSDIMLVDSGQTAPDDTQSSGAAATQVTAAEQATVVDDASLPATSIDAEISALEHELSTKENKSPGNVAEAATRSKAGAPDSNMNSKVVSSDAPAPSDDQRASEPQDALTLKEDERDDVVSRGTSEMSLREALNEAMLKHLKAEGVNEALVRNLRLELQRGKANNEASSELLKSFQFATDCSLSVTVVTDDQGKACEIQVRATMTVQELKSAIEERLMIPTREQTLHKGDVVLKDSDTLASCNITPRDAAVRLVHKPQKMTLSGATDGRLKLWMMEDQMKCERTIKAHDEFITAVAVDWFRLRAVSGSEDGMLKMFDLTTGETTSTMEGHDGSVNSLDVEWSTMRCISGSNDFCLKLWDLGNSECKRTMKGKFDIWAVRADWKGMRSLCGSIDSKLHLWNLETGECLRNFSGHGDLVTSLTASWESERALSGSFDQTLRLWDIKAGQCVQTFQGHTDSIWSVVGDWERMRAVSGSADCTLRYWDLSDGSCLRTLSGHTLAVRAVVAKWGLKWVISGSRDRTVRLWNLETGECMQTLKAHVGAIWALATN